MLVKSFRYPFNGVKHQESDMFFLMKGALLDPNSSAQKHIHKFYKCKIKQILIVVEEMVKSLIIYDKIYQHKYAFLFSSPKLTLTQLFILKSFNGNTLTPSKNKSDDEIYFCLTAAKTQPEFLFLTIKLLILL